MAEKLCDVKLSGGGGDMTFEYYATGPSSISFKPKGNWAVSYSQRSSNFSALQFHTTDMADGALRDIRFGVISDAQITEAGYTIGADGTISRGDMAQYIGVCVMYQAD